MIRLCATTPSSYAAAAFTAQAHNSSTRITAVFVLLILILIVRSSIKNAKHNKEPTTIPRKEKQRSARLRLCDIQYVVTTTLHRARCVAQVRNRSGGHFVTLRGVVARPKTELAARRGDLSMTQRQSGVPQSVAREGGASTAVLLL